MNTLPSTCGGARHPVRIAFVDDDESTLAALETLFSSDAVARRWTRNYSATPTSIFRAAVHGLLDLVVTDLRFQRGEMNGLDFIRAVRAAGNPIPIILYSGWPWTSAERAACLRAGASDVIHKPFESSEELVARIERLLVHHAAVTRTPRTPIVIGSLRIEGTEILGAGGRELALTSNSRALLLVLTAAYPRHATHQELLRSIGYTAAGSRHTLSQAIAQLRKQLGRTANITAAAGLGYRLVVDVPP